jgi:hypothetical protein
VIALPKFLHLTVCNSLPRIGSSNSNGKTGHARLLVDHAASSDPSWGHYVWSVARLEATSFARKLVELASDQGTIPCTFEIEYEGTKCEVEVRANQTEVIARHEDFVKQLPG